MKKNDLIFLPLGGTGEIGMNINLYHYQGKWLMIDCGAGFADYDLPGVDIVVADTSFIEERKKDLVGIIITHAHEDHCGALQYLWSKLDAPIYTTKFTASFLTKKIGAKKLVSTINVVEPGKMLDLFPFKLEFINMTHSVPEMNAIAIHTEEGIMLHSGDWKLDDNPVIGNKSDFSKLREIAEKGVTSIICDSTNVFSNGRSESESVLYPSIKNIIQESKGVCVVTLFSSNVSRIETISRIARELDKQIAVLGRALMLVIDAGKESGYLKDLSFINADELSEYKNREKLIILATGCQGDELASVNKLSQDIHPFFKLKKNDTVIFSSKMIPGNEKRISNLINRFVGIGVNVITEKTHKVHVSGHPYRDELKEIYHILQPQTVIPVHGENMHLYEHAKFAKECGVKQTIIPADGDMIKISKENGIEKINSIKTGFLCVDNEELQDPEGEIIQVRKRLQNSGLIILILVVNGKFKLLKKPIILTFGYTDSFNWKEKAIKIIETDLQINKNLTFKTISKLARKIIRNTLIYKSKMPLIEVQIERL
jgi:ribonuclease J